MRKLLGILSAISLVSIGFFMEPFFPLGDWRWLVVAVFLAAPAIFLYRNDIVAFLRKNKNKEKEAWEVPGAPQKRFKLIEAACLLANLENTEQWPLTNQRAKDEYQSLVRSAKEFRLRILVPDGGTRIIGNDERGQQEFYLGWKGIDEGLEAIRSVEVERQSLRAYLRSESRPIPEFLDERFDMSKDRFGQ